MSRRTLPRRDLLKAGVAAPFMLVTDFGAASTGGVSVFGLKQLLADVQAYAGAGNKQAGGTGDRWTADWTAKRLVRAGFRVERQAFKVPWFQNEMTRLVIGERQIALLPQPLVVTTPNEGLAGPLRLAEGHECLDGAIAIVRLPYRRWSTIVDPAVRMAIDDAAQRGARAIILVTTGPTGEALLLNAPADKPSSPVPLALLAPKLLAPVIEAARSGAWGTMFVRGIGATRSAENIIGRRYIQGRRWIVVSTPRSGWTDCVGERGPGMAIWLALAEWLPHAFPGHNLLFVTNSGHEFENLGASHLIAAHGPPPADTDVWLHLGANVATRDWQELPDRLLPLPSADPFRFLMTSTDLVDRARVIFAGQPGLEMVYPSNSGPAGELSEVIEAGYPYHAGIFGAHRYHHAAGDNLSVIVAEPLVATAQAIRELLTVAIPEIR